jgi:hypothetical protein
MRLAGSPTVSTAQMRRPPSFELHSADTFSNCSTTLRDDYWTAAPAEFLLSDAGAQKVP